MLRLRERKWKGFKWFNYPLKKVNLQREHSDTASISLSFIDCRRREHHDDRVERRHAPLLLRLLALHPVPPPLHRDERRLDEKIQVSARDVSEPCSHWHQRHPGGQVAKTVSRWALIAADLFWGSPTYMLNDDRAAVTLTITPTTNVPILHFDLWPRDNFNYIEMAPGRWIGEIPVCCCTTGSAWLCLDVSPNHVPEAVRHWQLFRKTLFFWHKQSLWPLGTTAFQSSPYISTAISTLYALIFFYLRRHRIIKANSTASEVKARRDDRQTWLHRQCNEEREDFPHSSWQGTFRCSHGSIIRGWPVINCTLIIIGSNWLLSAIFFKDEMPFCTQVSK